MHNTFKQSTAKENKDKEKINKKWPKAPWNLVQILQRSKKWQIQKAKTVCGYDRWKNGWKVCKKCELKRGGNCRYTGVRQINMEEVSGNEGEY
jgi:hypothetical protein